MHHTFKISGMTCTSCQASVEEALISHPQVTAAVVDLQQHEATISMASHIPTAALQDVLPDRYTISELDVAMTIPTAADTVAPSKLQQLKPLFLILGYILAATILIHYQAWDTQAVMLDFMGLFFIVFSFFKMLDVSGFATSFAMYDPLARVLPTYGRVYPFIETALGLMLLMRIEVVIAVVATIVILGITTIGVTRTLLDKRQIKCACLGTALNLPMTEATFIENAIMIAMAVTMLTAL